jgi:hypothetical protein
MLARVTLDKVAILLVMRDPVFVFVFGLGHGRVGYWGWGLNRAILKKILKRTISLHRTSCFIA